MIPQARALLSRACRPAAKVGCAKRVAWGVGVARQCLSAEPGAGRTQAHGTSRSFSICGVVRAQNVPSPTQPGANQNIQIWEEADQEDYDLSMSDLLAVEAMVGNDHKKNEEILLASARFLRIHLPPKIARRIMELESLPFPFQKDGGSYHEICNLYKESFASVISCKMPANLQDEAHFSDVICKMKRNHLTVRQMVSEAMSNMKCTGKGEWVDHTGQLVYVDDGAKEGSDYKVQNILRSFYLGRIGLRILVDQHLMLRSYVLGVCLPGEEEDMARVLWSRLRQAENVLEPSKTVLHRACNPKYLVEMAVADADKAYSEILGGKKVNVRIEGHLDELRPVVPEHLYKIMFEVLTNAIHASIENTSSGGEMNPIIITIGNGPGVFIKFADRGGGMKSEYEKMIWKFTFSKGESKLAQPAQGLKQGLPLSSLYAAKWGGDIKVLNLEGVGCDVLIEMPMLSQKVDDGKISANLSYPFSPAKRRK